jgi:hypothetical protein
METKQKLHIIPVGDTKLHSAQQTCWCHPNPTEDGLWVHNAQDCREARERISGDGCSEGWVIIAEDVPLDSGEISDGFHTFNELYDHRCTLFLALMSSNPALSWISAKHHDGSEWEGWFIAGMELPTGDVTYHLPTSMMGAAMNTGCRVLDCGKEWEGHTASDVVTRLREWVHSANKPTSQSHEI